MLPNIKFSPMNDRLCYISITVQIWDIIVILYCYVPIKEKDDEDKNQFYYDLERLYNSLPRNCVKIIIGDLRAQIGREPQYKSVMGQNSLYSSSNDNGMKVINFSIAKHWIESTTHFPHFTHMDIPKFQNKESNRSCNSKQKA